MDWFHYRGALLDKTITIELSCVEVGYGRANNISEGKKNIKSLPLAKYLGPDEFARYVAETCSSKGIHNWRATKKIRPHDGCRLGAWCEPRYRSFHPVAKEMETLQGAYHGMECDYNREHTIDV